jgi:phospholipid-translocating ATPase
MSIKYPALYLPGQSGSLFNRREFLNSVMHGIITSLILFFIPYGTMNFSVQSDGKDASDIQSFGFAIATILVIVVNLQVSCLDLFDPYSIYFFDSFSCFFPL